MSLPICRPPTITCRWLNEMTRALSMCDALPIVSMVQCQTSRQTPSQLWTEYVARHQLTTTTNEDVQAILSFEKDYHEFLEPMKNQCKFENVRID